MHCHLNIMGYSNSLSVTLRCKELFFLLIFVTYKALIHDLTQCFMKPREGLSLFLMSFGSSPQIFINTEKILSLQTPTDSDINSMKVPAHQLEI